jgi:hypothetical protein
VSGSLRSLALSHTARRIFAVKLPTGKAPEFLVELLVEPTDRARAKTVPTELFADRLDFASRYSLDVHLRKRGHGRRSAFDEPVWRKTLTHCALHCKLANRASFVAVSPYSNLEQRLTPEPAKKIE